MKKKINLENYKRKELLKVFKDYQFPHFSTTCNVNITNLKEFVDRNKCGFFLSISFLLSKSVNLIPELRHRIIDGELFEFEQVNPAFTVLLDDETFSFCDCQYFEDFGEYREYTIAQIEKVKESPDLNTKEKHHMFFMSNIPWFSFLSMVHPYDPKYGFIPLIAIGKYFEQENQLMLPVGIQVHHGVVDGIHVGKFYNYLSEMCHKPEAWLS